MHRVPLRAGLRRTMFLYTALLVAGIAAPAFGAFREVQQIGNHFIPQTLIVAHGDVIHWFWNDGFHTVTSGKPCTADGLLDAPLDEAHPVVIFPVPDGLDELPYFCKFHCITGMTGLIKIFDLGDMNCDGKIDAFDIDPFVLALTDPDGYTSQHPDCDVLLADVNDDGAVDAFDIDPFVDLLTGS